MTKKPSAEQDVAAEIAQLSYEQARDELVNVVTQLEAGAQTLDEAMTLWERGELLAQHCEQWLAGARARLSEVKARAQADPDATSGPDAAPTTSA